MDSIKYSIKSIKDNSVKIISLDQYEAYLIADKISTEQDTQVVISTIDFLTGEDITINKTLVNNTKELDIWWL